MQTRTRSSDAHLLRDRAGRFAEPEPGGYDRAELYAIWTAARAEANIAYDAWAAGPDAVSYAVYRAAEDRADAAQDALAALTA